MHAEDFLDHDHQRPGAVAFGRTGIVAGHCSLAGVDVRMAGLQLPAVGEDGAGGDGLHGQGETQAARAGEKAAAGKGCAVVAHVEVTPLSGRGLVSAPIFDKI
ncbi:hypothetical protein ABH310_01025 [Chromobacterium piscinae]